MVRPRGRCCRGERLIGEAPWGHWKTTTFAAGVCCNEINAPCVLDGAINGQAFLAWISTEGDCTDIGIS
jgi:hypothetical protein